jgi:hypothetical protein
MQLLLLGRAILDNLTHRHVAHIIANPSHPMLLLELLILEQPLLLQLLLVEAL